jgi:hypothetical protein
LERAQSWGLIFVTLGVGIFLACLGAWLFLKPGTKEIVKVEVPPAQVVKVEVPTPIAQPTPPPAQPDMSQYIKRSELPEKTSTGESIQREVTVFSKVEHPPGTVLTGWTFKDGAAGNAPIHQYCYYMDGQPTNDNPKTGVIYIATNGTVLESADKSASPQLCPSANEVPMVQRTIDSSGSKHQQQQREHRIANLLSAQTCNDDSPSYRHRRQYHLC